MGTRLVWGLLHILDRQRKKQAILLGWKKLTQRFATLSIRQFVAKPEDGRRAVDVGGKRPFAF